MMTSISINKQWFEEVKNSISYNDPYFYTENGREYVEVDVNESQFNEISRELGWME